MEPENGLCSDVFLHFLYKTKHCLINIGNIVQDTIINTKCFDSDNSKVFAETMWLKILSDMKTSI